MYASANIFPNFQMKSTDFPHYQLSRCPYFSVCLIDVSALICSLFFLEWLLSGVTLWELFSDGATPYEGLESIMVQRMLKEGRRLSRPQACPQDVYVVSVQHKPAFIFCL